jgi:lysophospholipid acyltransferase (LPLAT)-like uncharacterized protein
LLQAWARTLRYQIDDRAALIGNPVRENYIGSLWHNRLLLISYVLKRFAPHRPGAGLIRPDGPRGPVYELGPGIIFLAQKSGAPVLPIHLEYSSCWRLKSWDRFILPRPFSKVRVIFGSLHRVGSTNTPEEFETERLRLQNAMMALVERR